MSEERGKKCDEEMRVLRELKSMFRQPKATGDGPDPMTILRAYGDSRERAGIERAKRECKAARAERSSDTRFNKGFDRGTDVCEERIGALTVPAPAQKEAER